MCSWSGLRESDPSSWLGKPEHYHYAKPARQRILSRLITAVQACARRTRQLRAPSRSSSATAAGRGRRPAERVLRRARFVAQTAGEIDSLVKVHRPVVVAVDEQHRRSPGRDRGDRRRLVLDPQRLLEIGLGQTVANDRVRELRGFMAGGGRGHRGGRRRPRRHVGVSAERERGQITAVRRAPDTDASRFDVGSLLEVSGRPPRRRGPRPRLAPHYVPETGTPDRIPRSVGSSPPAR